MVPLAYQVIDNKALWGGRALSHWVPEAVARIVEDFAPLRMVLFGSVARGDDGPDSDLDLLVVFDRIDGRRHDVAAAILRATRGIGAPIDVFVTDMDDIKERGDLPGLLRVALREGKVVHERSE
jgi:predicted nucleotidyltransferase